MTNTDALNKWIEEHGLKKSFIAAKMGITKGGLSHKIERRSDFKQSEIAVFRSLGMTKSEINEIFLS